MTAREALFRDIWDMRSAAEKNALIDAHRDEVALEIGRDALRDGLIPTLVRLVGDANAAKLMDDFRDTYAHELAEQQRADATLREIEDETELAAYGRELADLIDPQAQPGQVRVTLDNRDAKFTPTVPRTPYFEDDDAQPNKPRSST